MRSVAVGPSGLCRLHLPGRDDPPPDLSQDEQRQHQLLGFLAAGVGQLEQGLEQAQKGIKGQLGTFRNHGTLQLTLNGQPLYYFTPDLQSRNKRQATGDELKTFGSIWHIVTAGSGRTRRDEQPKRRAPRRRRTTTSNPYASYRLLAAVRRSAA